MLLDLSLVIRSTVRITPSCTLQLQFEVGLGTTDSQTKLEMHLSAHLWSASDRLSSQLSYCARVTSWKSRGRWSKTPSWLAMSRAVPQRW